MSDVPIPRADTGSTPVSSTFSLFGFLRVPDITYRLEGFEFEWDIVKAQSNFEKHGLTFEEAAEVFLDPFHVVGDASANVENREFALGYSLAERLLLVVHTEQGIRTRIIARMATRTERRLYEQA